MSMRSFEGKKIFNGVAIGKIHFYSKEQNQVVRRKVEDAAAEWARYEEARQTAIEQLLGLYEKAKVEVGEDNAVIFEVHSMMLEDDDYNDSIRNIIENQGVNAEYAVGITGDNFAEMFASMDDEYMKARSADVKDISERVISILSGADQSTQIGAQPVVVFHEAYEYIVEEYGLTLAGEMNLDEERQVSAGEVADILHAIEENHVSVVLAEKLYGTDMGEMVAKQSGVKVIYLDTLTRGDYSADSYLEGMKNNIEQLKEAFQ